uniref:hydroxymethylglutaryl-CoA lyase n=1 Tax=Caligus rogercresseyi TaxID=217165 RepID=C1BML6_CALRO|nr:Hydroxymethylglutaryl-CoA lyase [Caligus rogercresseyi]
MRLLRFLHKVLLPPSQIRCCSSNFVKIVEVGPRDGLQNEKTPVPTDVKLQFIDHLCETGLKTVEATSFVSPKWDPQMADHKEVLSALLNKHSSSSIDFPVLVPNLKGLQAALQVGVKEIAIFGAASEGFSQKNINCSIAQSLLRFEDVMKTASEAGIRVRGYVSCIAACPYDGPTEASQVTSVAQAMSDMGCYEVSLGDTIGAGTPGSMERVLDDVLRVLPAEKLAVHCHDTYGQALANILVSVRRGIRVVDASVAGLGGCPYARGASGNVSTEDVVYMLQGTEYETGVDLSKLIHAGNYISDFLGRPNMSKVALAMTNSKKSG